MYLPYLRGKQNELLALQELLRADKISDKILPIVEPVNLGSTLLNTVKQLVENKKYIAIVKNGIFDMMENINSGDKLSLFDNKYCIKAYIVNQQINDSIRNQHEDIILINNTRDTFQDYKKLLETNKLKYSLIPDDRIFKRNSINPILFEDNYKKREKNEFYAENDDEYFSDICFYFKDDGYVGFSDYSIIGKEIPISGFAPRAVALHIIYKKENEIRIKHFVSNSNSDISNPAKKFEEAAEKMYLWVKDNEINMTYGLKNLMECYENKRYPGLGVIKRYSIMNHLELINNILEDIT